MQTYRVILKSDSIKSFRCQKAANSVDLNIDEKLTHDFSIETSISSDYNLGLIVGSSGSGKSSLARVMFGENFDLDVIDKNRSIIDQFPEDFDYDLCVKCLSSMGLSSVPRWIRSFSTLSNGEQYRARAALCLAIKKDPIVLDEWTSVVDRNVGQIMSHCLQKNVRKLNRKVVVLSCHYDVIDWLKPDWIIDCNSIVFETRNLNDYKKKQLKLKLEKNNPSYGSSFLNIII